jgi:nitrate reductase alpha subunit
VHGGRPGQRRDRPVGFPYFGGIQTPRLSQQRGQGGTDGAAGDVLVRTVPVQRISLGKSGEERSALVATVFDLQVANYGVARGLPGELAATSFDDDTPYTPAWQEKITGTPRAAADHRGAAVCRKRRTRPRASPWSSSARP